MKFLFNGRWYNTQYLTHIATVKVPENFNTYEFYKTTAGKLVQIVTFITGNYSVSEITEDELSQKIKKHGGKTDERL